MNRPPLIFETILFPFTGEEPEPDPGVWYNLLVSDHSSIPGQVIGFAASLQNRFMVTITLEDWTERAASDPDNGLGWLYLLLCLSGEFESGKKKLHILIRDKSLIANGSGESLSRMLEFFLQQGEEMELVVIDKEAPDVHWVTAPNFSENAGMFAGRVILDPQIRTGNWLALEQHDEWYRMAANKRTTAVIEKERDRWKQRADLYRSFIPLATKITRIEYEELKEWYHREYEQLPTWYKRAGHLIKALTGRRTFRSLIRDDVKRHQ